jgi:hypothetical protein
MYYNLYDEQAGILRNMVAYAEELIQNAQSTQQAYQIFDEQFADIWKFYEYNQKAYTQYRNALAIFEGLSDEVKEQAMTELSYISYRVAANYKAIEELIAKYSQGEL